MMQIFYLLYSSRYKKGNVILSQPTLQIRNSPLGLNLDRCRHNLPVNRQNVRALLWELQLSLLQHKHQNGCREIIHIQWLPTDLFLLVEASS